LKRFLSFIFAVGLALPAFSATYYIDYGAANDSANGLTTSTPWKRCPGMVGFAGTYSHSAGDVFTFKGGVTWPKTVFPLTIGYSGAAGNVDTYTVDQTWYSGGAYDYPVFDGETTLGGAIISIPAGGRDYIKINGLKMQNCDNGTNSVGAIMIDMYDGRDIEISYCWLAPNSIEAFDYLANSKSAANISIHHCTIRNAIRGVVYATTGFSVTNVSVYNNDWQGPGTMYMGGYHADGLMVGDPIAGVANSIYNLRVYNNKFYGNWQIATAIIYSNGGVNGAEIYNNVFSLENTNGYATNQPIFGAFCQFYRNDTNLRFYNNTFSSDAMHGWNGSDPLGAKAAIAQYTPISGAVLTAYNNLFSKCAIGINVDATVTVVSDYNLHEPDASHWGYLIWGATAYSSLAAAQGAGYELHSPALAYASFVTVSNGITGGSDFRLQTNSPAIGAGTNLSALFTGDILGTNRGSSWTLGAYQSASSGAGGGDVTTPTVTITSPTHNQVISANSIAVSGTSSDDVAVSSVALTNTSMNAGATVTGTTSWTATIPLRTGTNLLSAVATDSSGNKATNTITVIYSVAKQIIGPVGLTTARALARWLDTSAYKLANSSVVIDDLGNVSGVSNQTIMRLDVGIVCVSNNLIFIQQNTAPIAGDIGGSVGSVTNCVIRNVNGILNGYYSDGVTLWTKQLAP